MSDPTDQRQHLFLQALQQQEQRRQVFLQQQQPPQHPHPQLAMQQQQQPQPQMLPARAPSPQGFGGVALMPPMQGVGLPAQVAAARARAAEQMAFEDAWKASNPDFKTPFASIEDAVSRLLPYHVFAEYEEDDVCDVDGAGINIGGGAAATEKSFVQKWDDDMEALELKLLAEFEKHVVSFNVITRQRAEGADRGEERLMLERALIEHERWQSDSLRAVILQEQREQEAARARLALAQAQAANAWPLVQPATMVQPTAWHQALAAASRGEGISGTGQMAAPAVVMLPQQEVASAWHLQQLGVWQTFVAPRGEGTSSGQAAATAAVHQQQQQQQQQAEGQTTSGPAAAGMVQPWWGGGAVLRGGSSRGF